MRAPYQVLIFPYYRTEKGIEYAIFHRSDADWWQAISGGGEDGETIMLLDAVEVLPHASVKAHDSV